MLQLLMRFLPLVLQVVSPQLRKDLVEALDALAVKAKATDNDWDDYLVAALRQILIGR